MFDTERFIEEIERRPAIYDVNRGEYNDRNAKMTAWDEVCQVMVPNWARLTDEERNVEGIYSTPSRSIDPDSSGRVAAERAAEVRKFRVGANRYSPRDRRIGIGRPRDYAVPDLMGTTSCADVILPHARCRIPIVFSLSSGLFARKMFIASLRRIASCIANKFKLSETAMISLLFPSFREESARQVEKHTGLLHEGTQASKIAADRTRRTEAQEVHVLRPPAVPHANGGEQEVHRSPISD